MSNNNRKKWDAYVLARLPLKLILKLIGWEIVGETPTQKCVLIGEPHGGRHHGLVQHGEQL